MRDATSNDTSLILEFIRGLAEYEKLPNEVEATEEGLRSALFGKHPGAEVIIAEWEGLPAGFALYCHNFSTFLGRKGIWLEDLFVLEAYRGLGVGRALLTRLASIAVAQECGRLEWSVLDWNADAIGFYRRLGAEPKEDWTTFRLSGGALTRLANRGMNAEI